MHCMSCTHTCAMFPLICERAVNWPIAAFYFYVCRKSCPHTTEATWCIAQFGGKSERVDKMRIGAFFRAALANQVEKKSIHITASWWSLARTLRLWLNNKLCLDNNSIAGYNSIMKKQMALKGGPLQPMASIYCREAVVNPWLVPCTTQLPVMSP